MVITVKDFLQDNPSTMLDLLTPKGLIQLTPNRGQWLLTKNGANARIKVTCTKDEVVGSGLLINSYIRLIRTETKKSCVSAHELPVSGSKKTNLSHAEFDQIIMIYF